MTLPSRAWKAAMKRRHFFRAQNAFRSSTRCCIISFCVSKALKVKIDSNCKNKRWLCSFFPFLLFLDLKYSTPYDSDKPVRIHDDPGRCDERPVLGRYYWPFEYDTWWRTRSKSKHVYEYSARTRSFLLWENLSYLDLFVHPLDVVLDQAPFFVHGHFLLTRCVQLKSQSLNTEKWM